MMDVKKRLRNSLIRRIQQLSTEKLSEINGLLGKFDSELRSKDATLKLAGSWKGLDEDLFVDLTEKLHANRANDRHF